MAAMKNQILIGFNRFKNKKYNRTALVTLVDGSANCTMNYYPFG